MSAFTTLKTPPAEVHIDEALLRKLLQSQCPDFAPLSIQKMGAGWDNEMYRLGEDYAIRVPRRAMAVPLIQNEQKWLPQFAKRLPITIPVPIFVGKPEHGYPWTWSIVQWQAGQTANETPPQKGQGIAMANFLLALHTPAPADAPQNAYRGVPLQERQAGLEEKMAFLKKNSLAITPIIEQIWAAALAAEPFTKVQWIHGDLHGRNVLIKDGKITCVLDWGDMTSGDVASDLVAIWTLFDNPKERQDFIETYSCSPPLLKRAKGWAIYFATVLLANGLADNPAHAKMGRDVFRRLEEDYLPFL